jgi:hypothetical protein
VVHANLFVMRQAVVFKEQLFTYFVYFSWWLFSVNYGRDVPGELIHAWQLYQTREKQLVPWRKKKQFLRCYAM